MVPGAVVDEKQVFEYDVQLSRPPHDSLLKRYPGLTVRSTEPQTALRRWVENPEELNLLLVEIATLGLTLTDVHRVASPEGGDDAARAVHRRTTASDVAGTYELRVVGELGKPLVRHLGCTHYPVQKQTLVRLTLVAEELHRFLQACAECGAGLERVRRVRSRAARASDQLGPAAG